jgi:hypothetical protein
MESNITLSVGFKGAQVVDGQPMFNPSGSPLTVGGIMSSDNAQTCKFGRVVSCDSAVPHEFDMGKPGSNVVVGILLNENAVQENDPAKPDYLLPGFPATVVFFGPIWKASWTKTADGSIDPVRGSTVIFNNTTGVIEFIAPTSPVPSGWSALSAVVAEVNEDTSGALLMVGLNADASPIIDDAGHQLSALPFNSDTDNAINFENRTVGTALDGTLISTGSTWLVHETANQCAFKLLCASSAITGDYATMRVRARADGAVGAGPIGVVAGNFAASANIDDYPNLYAIQGYAQPLAKTQANADNIVCALYGCVQRTAASVGRSWCLWVDTHATVKASGGDYLARFSHNGGAINLDGVASIYPGQGIDTLFNFECADTVAPLSECVGTAPAADGIKIAIKTLTGTYYLRAASAWS